MIGGAKTKTPEGTFSVLLSSLRRRRVSSLKMLDIEMVENLHMLEAVLV